MRLRYNVSSLTGRVDCNKVIYMLKALTYMECSFVARRISHSEREYSCYYCACARAGVVAQKTRDTRYRLNRLHVLLFIAALIHFSY